MRSRFNMLAANSPIFRAGNLKLRKAGIYLLFCVFSPVWVFAINNNSLAGEEPIVLGTTKSGLGHYRNARDVMVVLKAMVEEDMMPSLGFPIKFRFYDTDQDMYRAVARKEADIGCGYMVDFLDFYHRGLVKPVLWFYQKDNPGDYYCLVLRGNSSYRKAGELRKASLGYSHPGDLKKIRHVFFPQSDNFNAKQFFGKTVLYQNSSAVLAALMHHDVDVVFESKYSLDVYLEFYPRLVQKIISPEIMADLPIFIRTSLEPEKQIKVDKIKEYFMNMHKKPKTQELLIFMGCDQVKAVGEKQERAYREWIVKYRKMGLIP